MTGRALVALSLLAVLLVSGCTRLTDPHEYLKEKAQSVPEQRNFTVCHGYDCTFRTALSLDEAEWTAVRHLFEPAAESASAERRMIGEAIAMIERYVGARIGTDKDIAGIAYIRAGDRTQQDCIDESTNTTTYLTMMIEDGLIRRHALTRPASRGVFLDFRWYHQSAVIAEIGAGTEYVVDSWYNANGKPPLVTTLRAWQASYGRSPIEG